ncbi:putative colanic acid biosynthesis acetyltransferase [Coraliomargarita sinensis]|uniref:Putative colanic acid biosynthesis acetyltransferase n=1 Tax=Coraliomargarita sinensis TaxID=2174842 RepID=A0A317ZFQ5_9BACT|nr:putative colanic acid biosynthesis acetyltransferase [Coraliomargarita sinensis]PXA04220.1 putative colanic acid biosynthesis acetyltransferase [Coraliomargarita sinensis]
MKEPQHDSFQINLAECRTDWPASTKLKRGLWQCLCKPVYRLIPFRLSGIRIAILRVFGARIGHHCNIQKRVDILMPWNLEMGDYVALAHDTVLLNFARIRIESMSVVSQHSHLCTGSHDTSDPHFKLIYEPITIEAESWIASGAFVGPGVRIGRGCVIAARSVVTKDQPAWSICGGHPCKKLKERIVNNS